MIWSSQEAPGGAEFPLIFPGSVCNIVPAGDLGDEIHGTSLIS